MRKHLREASINDVPRKTSKEEYGARDSMSMESHNQLPISEPMIGRLCERLTCFEGIKIMNLRLVPRFIIFVFPTVLTARSLFQEGAN
jgi:hypothetical protein